MKKKNLFHRILQNTSCPKGFWGRMILHGMNRFHASLARQGMKQIDWQPAWNVLDVGCGGGANVRELLKRCPKGMVYGIDLSPESVAFARKLNAASLGRRCFIRQGNVCDMPYKDGAFDAVTAFETVYFWSPIQTALQEVARVLRQEGLLLISLEASNPDTGKVWTERIDGMVIHTAEELEALLRQAGFHSIRKIQHKEALHLVAYKR